MIFRRELLVLVAAVVLLLGHLAVLHGAPALENDAGTPNLWDLALRKRAVHRFSTLFTAQDVRDRLANEDATKRALDWCRQTGVTKVYVESFRDGYLAPRELLKQARSRFGAEGFEVAGCVTTTGVGKRSTGSKPISCYSDARTQEKLQEFSSTRPVCSTRS
jgi:hypothetical protein